MASLSRNLGRSRMMVLANTGAHTCFMKKKIFIHHRHTSVHSHSMRHYINRCIIGGEYWNGRQRQWNIMEYTQLANYSGKCAQVSLWGKVLALHVVGQVSQVRLGIVARLSCQKPHAKRGRGWSKVSLLTFLPQVTVAVYKSTL
jgi:hypothetical protein